MKYNLSKSKANLLVSLVRVNRFLHVYKGALNINLKFAFKFAQRKIPIIFLLVNYQECFSRPVREFYPAPLTRL